MPKHTIVFMSVLLGILIATYLICLLTCFVATAPIMCSMNNLGAVVVGQVLVAVNVYQERDAVSYNCMSTTIIVWFLFMA